MISTPATRARVDLYLAASWPASVEIAPSVTNTMLKPMIKAIEFSMTLRNSDASGCCSSSTPTPEISDTYPGTSGNTQGERKETKPATKAAIGSGRLPIRNNCTFIQTRRTSATTDCRTGTRLQKGYFPDPAGALGANCPGASAT